MVSLMTRTGRKHQIGVISQELYGQDIPLTTKSLKPLLFAEGAILNAAVTCEAIMGAFMETTLYAKQVAVVTFRLADLDACPEIYHRAFGCSP